MTDNNEKENNLHSSSSLTASTDHPSSSSSSSLSESSRDLSIQERANTLFTNKTILAPMVRASSTPLRTLALSYGADLVYSEELIDRTITKCDRVINSTLGTIDYIRKSECLSKKQKRRLNDCNTAVILRLAPQEKGKFVYQMGTGDACFALESALYVQRDVEAIDINMGCPKKFSVTGGMGSALLSDQNRACDIIKTLSKNVDIPVTAKIRLLKTPQQTIDFCQSLEKSGANAIAVHARHVGDDTALIPAKSDQWRSIVDSLSIPVILNGDLYNRGDIEQMKRETGASSVMLARPVLYNPSVFAPSPVEDRTQMIREYIQHALRWETNHKNVKYVICEMMNSRRHLQSRIMEFPQDYPLGQTISKVCACRNMSDLCKLWDVTNMTSDVAGKGNGFSQQETGEHFYSDDYFLQPDKFKRDMKEGSSSDHVKRLKMN